MGEIEISDIISLGALVVSLLAFGKRWLSILWIKWTKTANVEFVPNSPVEINFDYSGFNLVLTGTFSTTSQSLFVDLVKVRLRNTTTDETFELPCVFHVDTTSVDWNKRKYYPPFGFFVSTESPKPFCGKFLHHESSNSILGDITEYIVAAATEFYNKTHPFGEHTGKTKDTIPEMKDYQESSFYFNRRFENNAGRKMYKKYEKVSVFKQGEYELTLCLKLGLPKKEVEIPMSFHLDSTDSYRVKSNLDTLLTPSHVFDKQNIPITFKSAYRGLTIVEN